MRVSFLNSRGTTKLIFGIGSSDRTDSESFTSFSSPVTRRERFADEPMGQGSWLKANSSCWRLRYKIRLWLSFQTLPTKKILRGLLKGNTPNNNNTNRYPDNHFFAQQKYHHLHVHQLLHWSKFPKKKSTRKKGRKKTSSYLEVQDTGCNCYM